MAEEKISKVNKMKEMFEQKLSMKTTSSHQPSTFSKRPQFPPTDDLEQEDDSDISMMYIQKRSLVKNRLGNFKDETINSPVKPLRKVEIRNVVPIKEIEEEDEDDDDLVSMAYIKKKHLVSDRRGQFEKSDSSIIEEENEEDDFSEKMFKSKFSDIEILKDDLESSASNQHKVEDSICLAKKRLSNSPKNTNITETAPTLQITKKEKLVKITSFDDIDISLSDDYTISGLLSPSPDVTKKLFNLKPIVEVENPIVEIAKPPIAATRKITATNIEPPKVASRTENIKNPTEPRATTDSDDSDNEQFFSMSSIATQNLSTNYEDYSSIAVFSDDLK